MDIDEIKKAAFDEGYLKGHGDALANMGISPSGEDDEPMTNPIDSALRDVEDSGRILYTQSEVKEILKKIREKWRR